MSIFQEGRDKNSRAEKEAPVTCECTETTAWWKMVTVNCHSNLVRKIRVPAYEEGPWLNERSLVGTAWLDQIVRINLGWTHPIVFKAIRHRLLRSRTTIYERGSISSLPRYRFRKPLYVVVADIISRRLFYSLIIHGIKHRDEVGGGRWNLVQAF